MPYYGRELREYMEIPDDIFDDVSSLYRRDFEMYGYGYDRENGNVVTRCVLKDEDGGDCC